MHEKKLTGVVATPLPSFSRGIILLTGVGNYIFTTPSPEHFTNGGGLFYGAGEFLNVYLSCS